MINIPPINKGVPVLEMEGKNKTNFLSGIFLRWLKDVANRLNRAVVTDENGNIAYGGATIPDDVDPDFLHIFYNSNTVRIIDNTNNYIYDSINGYVKAGGAFTYISNGTCVVERLTAFSNIRAIFYAVSGVAGNSILFQTTYLSDFNGNVNIKTGSTYTATL